eukprot:scaffold106735_cov20-Tisochrysis_lutea.AAC.3
MQVCDRNVENLSGGELQRFAIAVVAAQEANVYMLDEPSSYLDVRQRLKAAQKNFTLMFLFDVTASMNVTHHMEWGADHQGAGTLSIESKGPQPAMPEDSA